MGQASSSSAASAQGGHAHKHFRSSEYAHGKNAAASAHGHSVGTPSTTFSGYSVSQHGGYNQQPGEDLIEDEGINCLNPASRGSYSPTDPNASFRFPGGQGSRAPTATPVQQGAKKIPCVFKYAARASAKEVQLVGSFTNWKDKYQMVKRYGLNYEQVLFLY
jgi:hypothetical protein